MSEAVIVMSKVARANWAYGAIVLGGSVGLGVIAAVIQLHLGDHIPASLNQHSPVVLGCMIGLLLSLADWLRKRIAANDLAGHRPVVADSEASTGD